MGNYESAEAVYQELGAVLHAALSNEHQLAAIRKADSIFQFTLTEPEAVMTCHARLATRVGIETGETNSTPDIVLAMEADVAKALLLKERSPVRMLSDGEIAIKGSATKVLQVLAGLANDGPPDASPAEDSTEPDETADAESPESEETADAVSSDR